MSEDQRDLEDRQTAWERGAFELLEDAYLEAGAGPGGSGSGDRTEGVWRSKRQHLAVPMDRNGDWLDVGCANGHLLATLPTWTAERGIEIRAHGLELIPSLADLARRLQPPLADRIWTGSVMSWVPPRPFDFVTALEDAVPPEDLPALISRLLGRFVAPGGRLILSSYTDLEATPRPLADDATAAGHRPDGVIHIDRPDRHPLQTVWFDHRT